MLEGSCGYYNKLLKDWSPCPFQVLDVYNVTGIHGGGCAKVVADGRLASQTYT